MAFAGIHVAKRALESNTSFVRRSPIESRQLDIATKVTLVHRYAAANHDQSKHHERCGDGNLLISDNELIHDKFSCGGSEELAHGRYHATMRHAAKLVICHASHQER